MRKRGEWKVSDSLACHSSLPFHSLLPFQIQEGRGVVEAGTFRQSSQSVLFLVLNWECLQGPLIEETAPPLRFLLPALHHAARKAVHDRTSTPQVLCPGGAE